ncbi:MAG: hypothetical protein J6X22_06670 [Muribaculaceae bacterium]|nr:hypothetical protein [Muribaculaceae bacterium]
MVKKLTNRLLGIFSVMMLMLMTSLSANAAYYLKGTFNNWSDQTPMTQRADGLWTATRPFSVGERFQIVSPEDVYYGLPADDAYWLTADKIGTGTAFTLEANTQDLYIAVAGTYTILFDETNLKMLIGEKAPVTVKNNDTHGSVSVNPTEAIPGETITITANPENGYYTDVTHITVEKTINGGSAQAPGMKDGPGIGQFITDIQAGENNTFTFAMPEAPYGAQVSAEFLENIVHSVIIDVDPLTAHGSVTSNKSIAEEGEEIILTITPDTGYELEELTVGGATVDVTGNTYTFTMGDADVHVNATFKKINYELTVTSNEYGSVTVQGKELVENKTTATFEESITLNIAANEDCELQELKVDGQVVEVTGNTYTFTMPNKNVVVTATFRKLDVSYWVVWGVTPENSNSWASENWIPMGQDGANYVLANQNMAAFSEFKIVKKVQDGDNDPNPVNTWYGAEGSNLYWITVQLLGKNINLFPNGSYANLYIPKDGTFSFTFTPATATTNAVLVVDGVFDYNITVNNTTPNYGTVTAPAKAKAGDEVELTVTPNEGYEVGNISVTYVNGDNTEEVPVTDNKFNMPAGDVTVNVTFNAKTYNITVAESTNGKVTAPESAACGSTVTLIVEPDEDCVLQSLTVTYGENNTPVEVNNNQFTMPAGNVTVTATFRKLDVSYWVVWGVTPENSNSWASENWIKMAQDGANYVLADQNMDAFSEFKIVKKVQDGENDPNPVETWYGVDDSNLYWITVQTLGKDIDLFPNGNYKNMYFPKDGTFTFTFTPATANANAVLVVTGAFEYNITVNNTTPNYGTVAAPAKAKAGDEVELTVTPADGYEIDAITLTYIDGENTVEVPVADNKFTMPAADVTVTATFKETVVEYHYGAVEEVKCTVLDQTNYSGFAPEGANITMRIVPSSDTKLKEVIVNKVTGSGQDMVETPIEYTITVSETGDIDLSFVMPAMDVEVHAICADAYAVTVNAGDHGSAQANVIEAYEGETVTVTTTPATEYKVDEIYYTYTVNGVEQRGELTAGENGVYTFAMPAAPVTVVVTFKTILDYYKLKFDAAPTGGTVSVMVNGESIQSMDEVAEFSPVNVTVTPDENYEIDSFKVYEGLVSADDIDDTHEVTYTYEEEDGYYRFEMPRTDATILVSFKQTQFVLEGVAFTAERKWATYIGSQNFVVPENVTAYVVTGVQNNAVVIDDIDYIPANVGVLLYSEVAVDQLMTTLYSGETSTYTTMLEGSVTGTSTVSTNDYVLYNNNFIRSEAGSVAAHRCYLPGGQVQGAPMMLRIGNNGDVPTAIETLMAEGNVANVMYVNMSGLTSDMPFRGINIAVVTFTDGTTQTIKLVK